VQRAAAVGIDADAIAVQAIGPQCVAFKHLHVDACPHQAVGERETASASTDHKDAW
jgi:hypothetical protein